MAACGRSHSWRELSLSRANLRKLFKFGYILMTEWLTEGCIAISTLHPASKQSRKVLMFTKVRISTWEDRDAVRGRVQFFQFLGRRPRGILFRRMVLAAHYRLRRPGPAP